MVIDSPNSEGSVEAELSVVVVLSWATTWLTVFEVLPNEAAATVEVDHPGNIEHGKRKLVARKNIRTHDSGISHGPSPRVVQTERCSIVGELRHLPCPLSCGS